MPPKGVTNNPSGRPKGSENKVTTELRTTIKNFVELNSTRLQGWLDTIEQENGALEAFKRIEAVLEYVQPKLARTEHAGHDGGAVKHEVSLPEKDKEIFEQFLTNFRGKDK